MFEALGQIPAGTQMIAAFFLLMAIGMPVAFALGLSALYAMWVIGFGFDLAGDLIAAGIAKYSLLAIPFFILAGSLMGSLGIAERMIRFFRVLIGSLPGGMGVVGTVVCLFWGAVSGSGPASVAAIGPMLIRAMEEDGYSRPFAAGLVSTGAAFSIVIPPSIGLVIYGVIAETSISDLFIAAIIPGIFMGLMMLAVLPFARRGQGRQALDRLSPDPYAGMPYGARLWQSFKDSFWGLMTPAVILGGIYSGIFTVTEGAAIGVLMVLVTCILRGTLTRENFVQTLIRAAANIAMIYLILIGAEIYKSFLTLSGLPAATVAWVGGLDVPPLMIVSIVILLYIGLGCIFDAMAAMILTMPFVYPLVIGQLGFDPIWWGIMNVMIIEIGMITPPVGINIFVLHGMRPDLKLKEIYRGITPFIAVDILRIVIFLLFPGLMLALV